MKFTISILRGDDAHRCRTDNKFVHAWNSLAARTPHETAFQESEFANTWYQEYESKFEPLLVLGYSKNNRLIGLVPLAVEIESGELVFAGAQHVEYSGWLCEPRCQQDFIIRALAAIKSNVKFKRWQWAHLSPGADDSWLYSEQLENARIYALCNVDDCPLLDLSNEEKLSKILKNKSVKSKINRLKRQGELRLERIDSKERVAQLLDHIGDLVNFRHESAHHDAAFEEEPIQKDFYLARGDLPAANHFTALWLGETLLAFNFGVKTPDTVYIGLTAFDPTQSKHSPGVIFLIYLAQLLKEENIRFIDFTPGGDEYKERFCNTYNTLQRPIFYSSKSSKTLAVALANIRTVLSRPFKLVSLMWENAMQELVKLPDKESAITHKLNTYQLHRDQYSNADSRAGDRVNIQTFQDLLVYNSQATKISRQRVLADATKRFSREENLFTIRNGNDLIAHGWASKPGAKYRNHAISYNPGTKGVVLDCLDLNLKLPKGPVLKGIVNGMLDYNFNNGAESAYIFIPKAYENKTQTRVLFELNFSKLN